MSSSLVALVLDHTALLALGSGHRLLSGLIVAAHREPGRYLYVPAMCLAAAAADRPQLAEHVGALPAMTVVDLDFAAAVTVGRLVRDGADWRAAHAVTVGRPDAEWPSGRPVLTAEPGSYAGCGVATVRLPPSRP